MNNLAKEFKIYQVLNKNVFGFNTFQNLLGNTFKTFSHYDQAKQWIVNEGKSQKEYIILEVFKKE